MTKNVIPKTNKSVTITLAVITDYRLMAINVSPINLKFLYYSDKNINISNLKIDKSIFLLLILNFKILENSSFTFCTLLTSKINVYPVSSLTKNVFI